MRHQEVKQLLMMEQRFDSRKSGFKTCGLALTEYTESLKGKIKAFCLAFSYMNFVPKV